MKLRDNESLKTIEVRGRDIKYLNGVNSEYNLAIQPSFWDAIQKKYETMERDPTLVELQLYDQSGNEHSNHPKFRAPIVYTENGTTITIPSLMKSFIKKPFYEAQARGETDHVLVDFGGDAGVYQIYKMPGRTFGIAFKVETHNHPSIIGPTRGAATGIGGILRDDDAEDSYKPCGVTDILGHGPGDLPVDIIPPGLKHPLYISKHVVEGIRDYGNNMGVPRIGGRALVHPTHRHNNIVFAGAAGVVEMEKRQKGKAKPGDLVVLIGKDTDKTGLGGTSFASRKLTAESSKRDLSAVQDHNPIAEERNFRLAHKVREADICHEKRDLGGGGISCAALELPYDFGLGIDIYLDNVHLSTENILYHQMLRSETQERMLYVIPKKHIEEFGELCDSEDVPYSVLGELTKSKHAMMYTDENKEELIADIDLDFAFSVPMKESKAVWNTKKLIDPRLQYPKDLTGDLVNLMGQPNIAFPNYVMQYDRHVQGSTALDQVQGKFGHYGYGDGAVITPLDNIIPGETNLGITITFGVNQRFSEIDPYDGAVAAVAEAMSNTVAVGGHTLAMGDNFTWGNVNDPEILGGLVRACQGFYDAATILDTYYITGKDSLNNYFEEDSIVPTSLASSIGFLPDARRSLSMNLKYGANELFLVGPTAKEIGGSEYLKMKGELGASVPKLPYNALARVAGMIDANRSGAVVACHDISMGGLGVALAEMAISGQRGFDVTLPSYHNDITTGDVLFGESLLRWVVEVDPTKREDFAKSIARHGIDVRHIGTVDGRDSSSIAIRDNKGLVVVDAPLRDLERSYRSYWW